MAVVAGVVQLARKRWQSHWREVTSMATIHFLPSSPSPSPSPSPSAAAAASSSTSSSSRQLKVRCAAAFIAIPTGFGDEMKMRKHSRGCSRSRRWLPFHPQGAAAEGGRSQLWEAGDVRSIGTLKAGKGRKDDKNPRGTNEALPEGKEEEEGTESEEEENESELFDELDEIEEEEEMQQGVEDIDNELWGEDNFEEQPVTGDGGDGGGFVLEGASWGDKALEIAEEVLATFGGDFVLYAFKVRKEAGEVLVRLDKLSDKYGSPTVEEIDRFSSAYGARLEDAGQAGLVPNNLTLEVSSPGAERFLRIPQDLLRFKKLPMYVRYTEKRDGADTKANSSVTDGIFELDTLDIEAGSSTWKVANVKMNRDSAGKGRGLTRKQRLLRLDLPFASLIDIRLYVDL